jgi:hypothetical protein
MTAESVERLATLQRPDGGFDSVVTMREGPLADRNGFTTAIVLRTLRHVPDAAGLAPLRRRALDFLEDCESPAVPGGYAFWPERLRPPWAAAVPADVDDTAIFAGELHRHGRLDRPGAMRSLCAAILPCRMPPHDDEPRPPWIPSGCFQTWIGMAAARPVRVVDCCVNANVAALMARLDARHLPGYSEAIRTVVDGLAWADEDASRLDSLTPFYPCLHALHDALAHAVECGAHELRGALDRVSTLLPAPRAEAGCCRSAYGRAVWRCPAVAVARAIAAGRSA